jgi:hypothetical protein
MDTLHPATPRPMAGYHPSLLEPIRCPYLCWPWADLLKHTSSQLSLSLCVTSVIYGKHLHHPGVSGVSPVECKVLLHEAI